MEKQVRRGRKSGEKVGLTDVWGLQLASVSECSSDNKKITWQVLTHTCMDINMDIKLAALPSLYLWNGLQPLHVTWLYPDLIFHHILSCLLSPFFYLPHEGQTLNATFEGIDRQGLQSRRITKCWFCFSFTQSIFSSRYILPLAGKIKF